jgi:proline utilization trans-activator
MISAVEREHRVRVWWSVYIIDRITSSKLGHPVTVRDSDIDVDLPSMERLTPSEREEFSDPAHIVAHLRLARITGDIISDIYGRSGDKAFVQSVHKILRSLRSWAETLPESVQISSSNPQRYSSRNVASLHLCFNQVGYLGEDCKDHADRLVCHPDHTTDPLSCLQVASSR